MKRFTTHTDESGVLNKKKFIVATAVIDNAKREEFEQLLEDIEKQSGKQKKWADVGVFTRTRYTKLLLKNNIFNLCTVYYGIFYSKLDYITVVSGHVAESIKSYANNEKYTATIFLDKINNRTTAGLQKAIHRHGVRYKKIRALDDTNNVGLKFIDAICGLVRDIKHEDIDESYKGIFKKLKLIS